MPPKKKSKKSQSAMSQDPLEYASLMRARMCARMESSTTADRNKMPGYDNDIGQNIREIKAILAVNEEIFGRCMEGMDSTIIVDPSDNSALVSFHRHSFDVIKVCPSLPLDELTRFMTEPVCSEKKFVLNSLIKLPDCLEETFVVKCMDRPHSKFIDYNLFFQNSLSLHDDVLGPFLAKLKDHIESVQVCLGEIDRWLLEPVGNVDFLNKTFSKRLIIPSVITTGSCGKCRSMQHQQRVTRAQEFGMRRQELRNRARRSRPERLERRRREMLFGGIRIQIAYDTDYSEEEPGSEEDEAMNADDESDYDMHESEEDEFESESAGIAPASEEYESDKGENQICLKEIEEVGEYKRTFNICEENERAKLKKFLDFIAS